MNDPQAPAAREKLQTEATLLLGRISAGDEAAAAELLPVVYDELRRIAANYFRAQPADHTLQPTALVHEAFMKLVRVSESDWKGRCHFKAVAARAMRQILTDHARAKATDRRGGAAHDLPLTDVHTPKGARSLDVLALEEALEQLGHLAPRQLRIIEYWFFAGLTMREIAELIGVTERTVRREWRHARAWLNGQLQTFDPS